MGRKVGTNTQFCLSIDSKSILSYSISVKVISCRHCSLMNLCFIHVVAILLYKDQNSPSSWQWLTRFEFGSFGGVSLVIKLTKRLNSQAFPFHCNSAHFTLFCQVRCLERSRLMREFCESRIFNYVDLCFIFLTQVRGSGINLRSSLTIWNIICQLNKVLWAAEHRFSK